MLKIIATGLAILLEFTFPARGYNVKIFSYGINGTFFCTKKPKYLAGLVFWDGKVWGQFPVVSIKRRGGLVCHADGTVEAGYFEVQKGKLLWNGKPADLNKFKWALTGGGLFLLDGKPLSAKDVSQKENLSYYITKHTRYSFILVHKDRKRVSIGVSLGGKTPAALAKQWAGKAYAILRLDGGSQTRYWVNSKPPRGVNNGIGWVKK